MGRRGEGRRVRWAVATLAAGLLGAALSWTAGAQEGAGGSGTPGATEAPEGTDDEGREASPAEATPAPGEGALATPAAAEPARTARGPVTDLPLPRFVSLRASEARARRGPSLEHRVDWLYTRRGLPLMVTAEHGHWRRVEDIEGFGGWVHHSLITGRRTVIVTEDLTPLWRRPEEGSPMVARLERGVIAGLDECEAGWCRLRAGGRAGWARAEGLWGASGD